MENYQVSIKGQSLHIEGFDDAVKVIAISGPRARRLADLALHKQDLEFANGCLDALSQGAQGSFIAEALWRSAIIHFTKCFGQSASRFQLSPEKILKGTPPEAGMAFEFFKHLRNRHLIHDENSYSQSLPGAILNSAESTRKIEKIVCLAIESGTLEEAHFGNLKLLIQTSLCWVNTEYDLLCSSLTSELESLGYEELYNMKSVEFRAPSLDELTKSRT